MCCPTASSRYLIAEGSYEGGANPHAGMVAQATPTSTSTTSSAPCRNRSGHASAYAANGFESYKAEIAPPSRPIRAAIRSTPPREALAGDPRRGGFFLFWPRIFRSQGGLDLARSTPTAGSPQQCAVIIDLTATIDVPGDSFPKAGLAKTAQQVARERHRLWRRVVCGFRFLDTRGRCRLILILLKVTSQTIGHGTDGKKH